jgi:hypothetical protein
MTARFVAVYYMDAVYSRSLSGEWTRKNKTPKMSGKNFKVSPNENIFLESIYKMGYDNGYETGVFDNR